MNTMSYRRTVLNTLIQAIRTNDTRAIVPVRAKAIAVMGLAHYEHLYKQAYNVVNTKDYQFIEFSPKVYPGTGDKSYVDIVPGHNED